MDHMLRTAAAEAYDSVIACYQDLVRENEGTLPDDHEMHLYVARNGDWWIDHAQYNTWRACAHAWIAPYESTDALYDALDQTADEND
jgi:hypothetical protein